MIQNHVTSLELSQKLKELGVPQKSEFVWERNHRGEFEVISKEDFHMDHLRNNYRTPEDLFCSAFLSSELGEMLPYKVMASIQRNGLLSKTPTSFALRIKPVINGWRVAYYRKTKRPTVKTGKVEKWLLTNYMAKTESDARAKMLIYLIENKLIQVESL